MHYLKTILTFLVLSLVQSCDPGSIIKYEIINNTAEPIKAKYQFIFGDNDTFRSGKIVTHEAAIPAGSGKIVNKEFILGYAGDFNETHDSMFLYLLTLQMGSKVTNLNFKDKKYWVFEKKGELEGTYKLIADTALFNKNN